MVEPTTAGNPGLVMLAQSLAYVIEADNRASVEEKAKMITVLAKHVARGELTQDQMRELTANAFKHAGDISLDMFLGTIVPRATPAQKLSLVVNLYDAMLVDGQVAEGERRIIDKFIAAFDLDRQTIRAVRELMLLKNDTAIFSDPQHPFNEPNFKLELKLVGASDPGKTMV